MKPEPGWIIALMPLVGLGALCATAYVVAIHVEATLNGVVWK